MTQLEEIREKLIMLDNFVQENKTIEKRLKVTNLEELKEYYKKVKDIIVEKIILEGLINIPRIIKENKTAAEANSYLIMDSSRIEQITLVAMFNNDLCNGYFDGTILQNGIFLPSYRTKYIKSPPKYLLLDPDVGTPNVNVQCIKFLFDKNALLKNKALDKAIQDNLKCHILQKGRFKKADYQLIKEYFLKTAPFVLNCLLLMFKDEYIKAKRENSPVILSTAMVNVDKDDNFVIVLETLYNNLLKQNVFKDTIFEGAVTCITRGNHKFYNPMNPLNECIPTTQYNLRIILNTYTIEKNAEKRLCYNIPK